MTLTLTEWDQQIAPLLQRIEAASRVCRTACTRIQIDVMALSRRPNWLTRAESELAQARKALEDVLESIKRAQELYEQVQPENGSN